MVVLERDDLAKEVVEKIGVFLTHKLSSATLPWEVPALPAADFVDFLVERLVTDSEHFEPPEGFEIGELYLARGCTLGNPEAVRVYEETLAPEIARVLARMGKAADVRADIAQNIFCRVFTGPDPKISGYRGRGKLASWLRVVATREALDLSRVEARQTPLTQSLLNEPDGELSPELELIRITYRNAIKKAFENAVQGLSTRDRLVLRHTLDGATAAEIGNIYRVHRVTIARWLSSVRSKLLAATRQQLQEDLSEASKEIDDVLKLFGDQVTMSFERLLATASEDS
tara:strand:+ start:143326 stop:144183 length:858 start_codon:yes stop_codon:yes gene_type:complete